MQQYFYAYHGPKNHQDFDPSTGYGVADESKRDHTKIGDLVYIIQKRPDKEHFELCGLFKIDGYSDNPGSQRPYRMALSNVSNLKDKIAIDENACSKLLPQINGNAEWSNFKRHFCRQGASFQSPLETEVINVLDKLFNATMSAQGGFRDSVALETQFNDEVIQSSALSQEQRLKILAVSSPYPAVLTGTKSFFRRNPHVVAEARFSAKGVCQACKKYAPFWSKGLPYLEVHHIKPLAQGGEDTIDNAIALCPNCHREKHFGA